MSDKMSEEYGKSKSFLQALDEFSTELMKDWMEVEEIVLKKHSFIKAVMQTMPTEIEYRKPSEKDFLARALEEGCFEIYTHANRVTIRLKDEE